MKKALIVLIISVLAGFAGGVHFNYVKNAASAHTRLQELVLFTDDSCYHIHHSMCFSLAMGCIAFGRYVRNPLVVAGVVGLMIGASLMDLLYPDWDLVKNDCHRAKIMRYFKQTAHHPGTRRSSGVS